MGLHYACGSGAPKEVITELLKAYPEGIRSKTNKGNTPLHCLNSVKNVGTANKREVAIFLRKTDLSISRRQSHNNQLVRRQSFHEMDTHFMEESCSNRRRCNTA